MSEPVQMNMIQALNDALALHLQREENAVILGEDVGLFGGVFRVTEGLQQKYGVERVFDTPLAEAGIVGAFTISQVTVDQDANLFALKRFDAPDSLKKLRYFIFKGTLQSFFL